MIMKKYWLFLFGILLACPAVSFSQSSVARQWNEVCLDAIRQDFPAPTVHSRNLYHLSAAMYDAWAAYSPTAVGVFHNEATVPTSNIVADRDEAISYAAYRLLRSRYAFSLNAGTTLASFDALMQNLGFDPGVTTTIGNAPATVGNRVANTLISNLFNDGSNQANLYVDPTGYQPVNLPLNLDESGVSLLYPNRWQPLEFDMASTQAGLVSSIVQTFVSAHWQGVLPFALPSRSPGEIYVDPGPPPYLDGSGSADDLAFKANNLEVIRFSEILDPAANRMIDLSPSARGNNPLGSDSGTGHPVNPVTGQPYTSNVVNHADYGRVSAEFWADGPQSETPPGHWNVLANEVSDHPLLVKRIGGTGPVVDDLEWDVKLYLSLNSALHDAAIAAWNTKVAYDYIRPISSIRYLGGKGQSSDASLPAYDPEGLPLVPGLVELISSASSAPGERHAHLAASVGQIAIRAWAGEPADPATQVGGSDWILPGDWLPYQRDTFVTPAFAGYVSGHSTFSRAAAEVLTAITGSAFFPGGIASHTEPAGGLDFEFGPSQPVTLTWATYYDAADEAGLSRLYGGIHVAPDDYAGRRMGATIGKGAVAKAFGLFDGSVLGPSTVRIAAFEPNSLVLSCPTIPGYFYKFQSSDDEQWTSPKDISFFEKASLFEAFGQFPLPGSDSQKFYRVVRIAP